MRLLSVLLIVCILTYLLIHIIQFLKSIVMNYKDKNVKNNLDALTSISFTNQVIIYFVQ